MDKTLIQAVVTVMSFGPHADSGRLDPESKAELDAAFELFGNHSGAAVARAFLSWHGSQVRRGLRPVNVVPPAGAGRRF